MTKLECVNHCHKLTGTALRKKVKDKRLGGSWYWLTQDKCTRLQNYYRGTILNNLNDQDAMHDAIYRPYCFAVQQMNGHTCSVLRASTPGASTTMQWLKGKVHFPMKNIVVQPTPPTFFSLLSPSTDVCPVQSCFRRSHMEKLKVPKKSVNS